MGEVDDKSLGQLEKVQQWMLHRSSLAEQQKSLISLRGPVTFFFYVIPEGALDYRTMEEPWKAPLNDKKYHYVSHKLTRSTYNADGFAGISQIGKEEEACGYTQLFRNGIVEYADSFCTATPRGDEQMVGGQQIEQHFVHALEDARARSVEINLDRRVYLAFSAVGLAGKAFFSTFSRLAIGLTRIPATLNVFNSPVSLVDLSREEASPYPSALLPLVDTMWQLGGLEESPFKSREGWDPFRHNL